MSRFIPITSDNFSPTDKRYLGHIVVGCLDSPIESELSRALAYAKTVPKLERHANGANNYYIWCRFIETGLRMWHKNRALGIIKGTVEGSVEAYQRYFGTPYTGTTPAALLDYEEAASIRASDDIDIASYLTATFSPLLAMRLGDPTFGDANSGVQIWQAVRDYCIPRGPAAKKIIIQMLNAFKPSVNNADTIVMELNQLFQHWATTAGSQLDDAEKVMYLLQHLPDSFSAIKTIINSRMSREGMTYEEAAKDVIDDERMRVLSSGGGNLQKVAESFFPNPNQTGTAFQYNMPLMQNVPAQPMLLGYGATMNSNNVQQPQNSPTSSTGSYGPRTPSPTNGYRAPIDPTYKTCYHCGEKGHMSDNCQRKAQGLPRTYIPYWERRNMVAGQQQPGQQQPGQQQPAQQQQAPPQNQQSVGNNAPQQQSSNSAVHYSSVAEYPTWSDASKPSLANFMH